MVTTHPKSIPNQRSYAGTLMRRIAAIVIIASVTSACVPAAPVTDAQQQSLESALEHTARIMDSIKCLIPSPQWYKNLWLDLNAADNDLGKALMTHYMGCSGSNFQLTESQFKSLPVALMPDAMASLLGSQDEVNARLQSANKTEGDLIATVDSIVLASTHYGNTLGHFQLHLRGDLIWQKNMLGALAPHFRGQARVNDRYDFNPSESQPKESWRGRDTELRVRIAHIAMPGRSFSIESHWLPFAFTFPKYESDLIQFSQNDDRSGYSEYGEKLQAILMTELRSERWQKATAVERVKIVVRLLSRLHQETVKRKS